MRVAALFSGGKDSTLAAYVAECHGWDVTHLVTVRPENPESHMFHVPNLDLTPMQAEAWGKPLVAVRTAGVEDAELGELTDALADLKEAHGLDGFVSGAVASEYQRTRLEGVGHRTDLKSFTPLWHKRPDEVVETLAGAGWDVRFAHVAALGLDEGWLGARMDAGRLGRLRALRDRYGVHVAGEGGEFETLVLDAPGWRRRIIVDAAERDWRRDSGTWRVTAAHLEPKPVNRGAA